MDIRRRLPSPGTVLGVLALIVATSGVAVGLPGKSSVDSGDIENGAVKAKDLAEVKFKPLDFQFGWGPYGGEPVNGPPGYAVDGFGFVHLQGAIAMTEPTKGPAFRLPASARPKRPVYHPVDTSESTYGRIYIQPNGFVSLNGEPAAYSDFTSLEGVLFKAK